MLYKDFFWVESILLKSFFCYQINFCIRKLKFYNNLLTMIFLSLLFFLPNIKRSLNCTWQSIWCEVLKLPVICHSILIEYGVWRKYSVSSSSLFTWEKKLGTLKYSISPNAGWDHVSHHHIKKIFLTSYRPKDLIISIKDFFEGGEG